MAKDTPPQMPDLGTPEWKEEDLKAGAELAGRLCRDLITASWRAPVVIAGLGMALAAAARYSGVAPQEILKLVAKFLVGAERGGRPG